MSAAQDLIDTILSDTVRVSKLNLQELRAELPRGWLLPPMISSATGTRWTSVQASNAIDVLAEIYRKKYAPYTVSLESFRTYATFAIGEMIEEIRAHPPGSADWLTDAVSIFERHLRARLTQAQMDLSEIVPCDVFDDDQNVPAFSIGPVQFMARDEWLATQPTNESNKLVGNVWSGALRRDDLDSPRQAAIVKPYDLLSAKQLVDHVGSHLWIATVPFRGHDVRQAHMKGPLFVELSLTFLGLFFDAESARRLLHAGIQGRLSETSVSMNREGQIFGGWKFNKPGVGGIPGTAQKLLQEKKDLFDAAGTILNRYSADSDAGNISRLIDRWINALYWYGRATRHDLDFMALADYGDALDILSDAGGNAQGMARYCATVLNVGQTDVISVDKLTLERLVKDIYNAGRSVIRHGNQFGLMAEFGIGRARARDLMRVLLLMVTEPLAHIVKQNSKLLTLNKNEVRAFLCVLSERHGKGNC